VHNPVRPNPTGFTFGIHDGIWKWRCWGDCRAVGTVVTFVERFLQIEPAHVRLWFHEHFANRLTARPPDAKRGGESRPRDGTTETKEARPVLRTPERAEQKTTQPEKLPEEAGEYKPIRFTLNLDRNVPYLKERGFDDAVLDRYGIGLCNRGLLKGYVAIPVWETPRGQNPYGYLGRWPGDDFNADDGRPKYRWPASFPKQRFLFGLNEALDGTDGVPLLVVEGVFDALRCVQNGYAAAVAIFGSSLSDQQAELLADIGRPVYLMFDGDEAGQSGMVDATRKLASRAFVRAIRLSDGQQPDDLSAAELQQLLGAGSPQMLAR
jgi:DNA primase